MPTDQERIAELEAKVASLESTVTSVKGWMNVMYSDMLRLQFAAAAAMKGDRDEANDLFRKVEANAKLLRGDANER